MANKLITQQATCTIAFGGIQDGVPAAYTGTVSLQCLAKSMSFSKKMTTVNLAAICDTEEQAQVIRSGGTLSLDLYVDFTGQYQFYTSVGFYVQVVLTPKAGGTALTFTGVLTDWEAGGAEGAAQTEKLTITIGTNGV